jgi:hypothetical protein
MRRYFSVVYSGRYAKSPFTWDTVGLASPAGSSTPSRKEVLIGQRAQNYQLGVLDSLPGHLQLRT